MTYSEWLEANTKYVLLDEEGYILAKVALDHLGNLSEREAFMGTLAQATGSKWSEASEYNFEG